ncbi:MAG: alpha amylase N-terminal ig-like domain-containing protein, partial [Defluviitaleaceae bacterium]|nr:alpha amylase N-terminal ig-like domain-containing protein [Defluviitaleaceae bacterium]
MDKKILVSEAVFADAGPNFISNPEPDAGETISISIRVFRDNFGDDANEGIWLNILSYINPDSETVMQKFACRKVKSAGLFDYYAAEIKMPASKINYYFSLEHGGLLYYYNGNGFVTNLNDDFNFTIVPGFKTPDWAKSATMYQIYVDRFANGDTANDVANYEYLYLGKLARKVENWHSPVENLDICNFYGGDLAGVMDKMAYLRDLGVQAIYFNPLFVSPSNHKYDIQDYDYIDPHYGVIINDGKDGTDTLGFDTLHNRHARMYIKRTTDKANLEASNQLMIRLIELAHSYGIKVILDGVFNHCGAFNKWLDSEGFYKAADANDGYESGALQDENSIYRDYFVWNSDGYYEGWWGHDNHPKLNFEGSESLYEYILHIGAKWVSPPFNADGWRLDVAADLGRSKEFNHKFWRDFRNAVKTANPNALILAEHYGDPSDWLDGTQWDSIMNYDAFMEPVSWFFTGMQKHSERFEAGMYGNAGAFEGAMRYWMSKLPYGVLSVAMNQLSNHDHSRFLTRTNMKPGRLHTVGAFEADMGTNKPAMM